MNNPNRFKQALALGALVISIIAVAAILSIPTARAQRGDGDDTTHPAVNVLPPVGIAFGQTLRVNFLKSSLYVAPGTSKGFDPQPDPPATR